MDLISVIAVLVVIGVILYLVDRHIPMAAPIKTVIYVVVILGIAFWLLRLFGVGNILVGR